MDLSTHARPLVIIAVAFASLSAILVRLSSAPPIIIAFYRMVFTSAMLLPLLAARYRAGTDGPGTGSTKAGDQRRPSRPGRPGRRTLLLLTASGTFLALHFATWNASLSYTTVASSVVLVTLHPIFVATGSVFLLGERVPKVAFLYIVSAIAGGAVLSYGDFALGGEAMIGNALAVAGAISVAGYMLIGRFLRRELGAIGYNVSVYLVAALVLLLFALLAGNPLFGYAPRDIALFAALAFFCTVLGHSILNWALKFVPASTVSTSILLEPIFATLMAMLLFEEIPGSWALLGGTIVVISLYRVIRCEQRAARNLRDSAS